MRKFKFLKGDIIKFDYAGGSSHEVVKNEIVTLYTRPSSIVLSKEIDVLHIKGACHETTFGVLLLPDYYDNGDVLIRKISNKNSLEIRFNTNNNNDIILCVKNVKL